VRQIDGSYAVSRFDMGQRVREQGAELLGDVRRNFRVGVGYNFTDFCDDLTKFDYTHRGWYLNLVGRY
jgi:hypothetical protein